jgi:NAD(P)-dependent dehydrogenase (short-subunit alcohol dehydrogenase family)
VTAQGSFRDRTVVVTGAASGIGRATALRFARANARLELADLNLEGLAEVREAALGAGAESVHEHRVDVAREAEVGELARQVHERAPAASVVVNAAGVAVVGSFLETSSEDWAWVLGVNLWGAIHTSRAFAPAMMAQGSGHIVNVASAAAFFAPNALIAYGVSKAAVVSFSETLRAELRPKKIGVSVICPGFVDTPIVAHARLRGEFASEREAIRSLTTGQGLAPESVAEAILKAVRRDHSLVPMAREAWVLYLLKRLTPSLLPALARRYQERKIARSGEGNGT